jgi:hypothetical protein
VSGSLFPSGGIQGDCNISKEVGGVEEISSKCCKFFKCEKLVLQVFESIKFKVESVWKRVFQIAKNFNFEV